MGICAIPHSTPDLQLYITNPSHKYERLSHRWGIVQCTMAPTNIQGSVTAWSSGSGSIKTEDGKEFTFTQEDIAPTRFSGPYQPKVGDKVIGNAKSGSEGTITNVMEFL